MTLSHDIKLTPKQMKFCEYYITGLSGKESYLKAYSSTCNDTTAYTEATRLLSRDDIQEYLKVLRKPLEEHARTTVVSEREKKRAIIWEEIEHAREQQDHTAIARYMDILNKMDAEYININRNIDDTHEKLDTLDIDTLKSLVQPSQDA